MVLFTSDMVYCAKQELNVGFKNNVPIYQFVSDDGKIMGINVDILEEIAKKNNLHINYIPMDHINSCINALENKEIDIILGMPSYIEHDFNTSIELTRADLYMIASEEYLKGRSLKDLKMYTVVFEYNPINYSIISNLTAFKYIGVANQEEVLEVYLKGRSDVMICDKNAIDYLTSAMDIEENFITLNNYVNTVGYNVAVRKNDINLLRLINDGIINLTISGEYEKIKRTWISENDLGFSGEVAAKISVIILAIFAIILVYIRVNSTIKFHLTKEIESKTLKLSQSNLLLGKQINHIEKENNLRIKIMENLPIAMIHFDMDYKIIIANNSVDLIIANKGKVLNKNILDLKIFGEILNKHKDLIFSEGFNINNSIVDIGKNTRDKKKYRYNILQTFNYGEVNGAIITVEDVTDEEKQKAEAFEKEKNKTLNRMIAGIAHEIKNPLMSIRTLSSIINLKKDDSEFQDKFSYIVPKEVDRINNLVESLINYARPKKREIELISMNNLIQECVYMSKGREHRGKIKIDLKISGEHYIEGDKSQLKQAITNIIINGLESMEEKLINLGEDIKNPLFMNIEVNSHGNRISIGIKDEGMGMSEEEIELCMEPFFTTKTKGTGLGMSLSRQYLVENNGVMEISSKKGEYTVINLSFEGV